jgi:hypothetical protein
MTESTHHEFDPDRAVEYEPVASYIKTAILVDVAATRSTTVLRTSFGEQQTMVGPFYIVAEGEASYGAARAEFERTHVRVDSCRWRKTDRVRAYQVDATCIVETRIGAGRETVVAGNPGDWIVRQSTGEVMVITDEAFHDRYRRARATTTTTSTSPAQQ